MQAMHELIITRLVGDPSLGKPHAGEHSSCRMRRPMREQCL